MTARRGIVAKGARPLGVYPHYVVAPPFLFVSGTSARQPDDSIPGVEIDESGSVRLDVAAQTRAVLANLERILGDAGLGLADLVDLTTFLVDMDDFAAYNQVYGEVFRSGGPARTTVAVRALPYPHLAIEMKATARLLEDG